MKCCGSQNEGAEPAGHRLRCNQETMRTFIAIDLPGPVRSELERMQTLFRTSLSSAPAANQIRWARSEGIHLTLKFLGEVSELTSERLIEHLRRLEPFKAFPVEVKGFGYFPDGHQPRVLWAGVTASPELTALAVAVEAVAAGLGLGKELRLHRPHLTLARFRSPHCQAELQLICGQEKDAFVGRFTISEFFLFESRLGASPEYRKLARFPAAP
ncbi:MAG: RNA 2',3'-cyclic phosphodiesterase [Terriglobia bacterium]